MDEILDPLLATLFSDLSNRDGKTKQVIVTILLNLSLNNRKGTVAFLCSLILITQPKETIQATGIKWFKKGAWSF